MDHILLPLSFAPLIDDLMRLGSDDIASLVERGDLEQEAYDESEGTIAEFLAMTCQGEWGVRMIPAANGGKYSCWHRNPHNNAVQRYDTEEEATKAVSLGAVDPTAVYEARRI